MKFSIFVRPFKRVNPLPETKIIFKVDGDEVRYVNSSYLLAEDQWIVNLTAAINLPGPSE